MSSGSSTQGSRGLSATGAVKTVRTCAVPGSSGTPLRPTIAGINRTTSIVTARATIPAAPFAIVPNEAAAMAHVCRAWVAKPNCGWISAFTVTGSKAVIEEQEYGRREAEPQESIREYRAVQSDQNGVLFERCQCVLHEDSDVEAASGIHQLAEGRHMQNVGKQGTPDSSRDEEKHSAQVTEDGSAFQQGHRELDSREGEG